MNFAPYEEIRNELREKQAHFESIDFPVIAGTFEKGAGAIEQLLKILKSIESEDEETK